MSTMSGITQLLARGLAAGLLAAGSNLLYFSVYLAATGLQVREPTWASVVVSSKVPCLLAALGYAWLARRTERAATYFGLVVAVIVVASFEGVFRATLPDGSPKPVGFDGLVMPMHLVVGLAAALVIPPDVAERIARWARRSRFCVRWQ